MSPDYVFVTPAGVPLTISVRPDGQTVDVVAPTGYAWDVVPLPNIDMVNVSLIEAVQRRAIARNYLDLGGTIYANNNGKNTGLLEGDVLETGFTTATLIASAVWNTDEGDGSVAWYKTKEIGMVSSADYIYYLKPNQQTVTLCEYNRATEEISEITIATLVYNEDDEDRVDHSSMCYIEDRKILFWFDNSGYGDYTWSDIYLIDFETDSFTVTLTYDYPYSVFSFQKENGDILLFSMGWNTSSQWTLYYKDWTGSGSWTNVALEAQYSNRILNAPLFVGEDYLCWIQAYSGSPNTAKGCALNLSTFEMQYSSAISRQASGSSPVWNCRNSAIDVSGKLLYGSLTGQQSLYSPYNYYCELVEYDPYDNTLTSIYYWTPSSTSKANYLISSFGNAYEHSRYNSKLYEIPSHTEIETRTFLNGFYGVEKDANGLVYYDKNGTLYLGALTLSLPSWIYGGQSQVFVAHGGDHLLVALFDDDQTPSSLYHEFSVYFYLIN
jgi:hypothetical protein